MNTAKKVTELMNGWKAEGLDKQTIAWKTALACVGWSYVFGARGQECTPANRRARYSDAHPTIKSKCKNFDGNKTCTGCKWYPGGRTRFFDCRGFTYWVLLQVYNWKLMGAGATSQWNTASNWKKKGKISDGIPKDTLVCLFYSKDNKEKTWQHTGFGFNNETVECSNGVQHFTSRNKKWTHWAVPACIEGDVPTPTPPDPSDDKPTLKRGSTGEYVTQLQNDLISLGYDVGKTGADGKYGSKTEAAVKAFQQANPPLKVDGICGKDTWEAIEAAMEPEPAPTETWTVTIPGVTKKQAEELCKEWSGATMKKG